MNQKRVKEMEKKQNVTNTEQILKKVKGRTEEEQMFSFDSFYH